MIKINFAVVIVFPVHLTCIMLLFKSSTILINICVILVDYRSIFRPCNIDKFVVHSSLNHNVGLLRVFPSIQTKTVSFVSLLLIFCNQNILYLS